MLDALGSDHRAWAATFERMDRDGNGDLTAREFEEGLRRLTGARLQPVFFERELRNPGQSRGGLKNNN